MFRTFSEYLTPIYKSFNNIVDINDPTIELEVRIANDNVNRVYFNRLKDRLSPLAYEKVIDSINGDELISFKKRSVGSDLEFFKRENLKVTTLDNYNLKLLINRQLTIDQSENEENIKRTKDCWFFEKNDCLVLLTKVSHLDFNKEEIEEKYEIEVKSRLNNPEFVELLEDILRLYYDTEIIWPVSEKNKVIAMITTKPMFSVSDFTQPRTMLWDDLTYNSLIKNPHCLHHKVDGFRKILIFNSTGIWLVGPNGDFNLVTLGNYQEIIIDAEMIPIDRRREGYTNAKYWLICYDKITDGIDNYLNRLEEVKNYISTFKNNDLIFLTTKKIWLFNENNFFKVTAEALLANNPYIIDGLIFNPIKANYQRHKEKAFQANPGDVIKWKPSQLLTIDFRVRHLPITSEVKLYTRGFEDVIVKGLIDKVNDKSKLEVDMIVKFSIDAKTKKLIPIFNNRTREFYAMTSSQLKKKFDEIKELLAKNINGKISEPALEELNKIRIKLKVVNINNNLELAVSDNLEKEFVGTKEFPFNKSRISKKGLENVEDSIVEFQLIDKQLVAYKLRNDKLVPNNNFVAEVVWNMVNDPITQEIITGQEGGLLRKSQLRFINRINYDYLYDFTFANSTEKEMIKMSNYRNVIILDWDFSALSKVNQRRIANFEFTDKNKVMVNDKINKSLNLNLLYLNNFKMDTYRSDDEQLLNDDEKKLSNLQLIVKIFNPKPRTEIIKFNKKDNYYLRPDEGLEVTLPYQDGEIKFNTAADNDDLSFLAPEDYTSGIVSISSINNSWFHCLIKAIYSEYQNNNEAALRLNIIAKIRRDLAITLSFENKPYYSIASKYVDNMDRDQMIEYMNSKQELEIGFIYLMAYIFEINIYLIEIPYKLIYNTRMEFDFKKSVILERFGLSDYRLIGKNKDGLIITLFDQKDEFIKIVESM